VRLLRLTVSSAHLVYRLTKHLGSKNHAETSISDDLAVRIADSHLGAGLPVLCGNGDNAARIIRYRVSFNKRAYSLRSPWTPEKRTHATPSLHLLFRLLT
jgi:hypothetical protein